MEFDMSKTSTPKLPSVIRDKCGTTAGYNYHRYKNEITCQPCRDAHYLSQILDLEKAKQWRLEYASRPGVREKKLLACKKYREANRAKVNLGNRDWEDRNPDMLRRRAARRRARVAQSRSEIYTEEQVFEMYGTDCYLCSEPIDFSAPRRVGKKGWERGLHIEHVIPITAGGSDTLENVRPSHGLCNLSKGSKIA
jgi:5-methylcytosine-specific restriction endonuclease McrA